jgi:hypothetical protein
VAVAGEVQRQPDIQVIPEKTILRIALAPLCAHARTRRRAIGTGQCDNNQRLPVNKTTELPFASGMNEGPHKFPITALAKPARLRARGT